MNKKQAKFYRKSFTSFVGILRSEEQLRELPDLSSDLDALVRAVHGCIESYFELVEFCVYVRRPGDISSKQAKVLEYAREIGLYAVRIKRQILARAEQAQAESAKNNHSDQANCSDSSLLVDALNAHSTILTQLTSAFVSSLMIEFATSDAQNKPACKG